MKIGVRKNENHYQNLPFIKEPPYSSLWLSAMDELDDPKKYWYRLEANGKARLLLPYEINVQKQSLGLTYVKGARLYLETLYKRPY
jgi:hypothetical protein